MHIPSDLCPEHCASLYSQQRSKLIHVQLLPKDSELSTCCSTVSHAAQHGLLACIASAMLLLCAQFACATHITKSAGGTGPEFQPGNFGYNGRWTGSWLMELLVTGQGMGREEGELA